MRLTWPLVLPSPANMSSWLTPTCGGRFNIGLGYVNNPDGVTADWVKEGTYEIEVACERFPAQASLRPLYDPKAERVKV